jgi:hypothetical protein
MVRSTAWAGLLPTKNRRFDEFADGEELADAWAESTLADRRMLLACVLKSLTIIPAWFPGDRTPILARVISQWVA